MPGQTEPRSSRMAKNTCPVLVRLVGLMQPHHIIRNKEHTATFSSNYWMLDFYQG